MAPVSLATGALTLCLAVHGSHTPKFRCWVLILSLLCLVRFPARFGGVLLGPRGLISGADRLVAIPIGIRCTCTYCRLLDWQRGQRFLEDTETRVAGERNTGSGIVQHKQSILRIPQQRRCGWSHLDCKVKGHTHTQKWQGRRQFNKPFCLSKEAGPVSLPVDFDQPPSLLPALDIPDLAAQSRQEQVRLHAEHSKKEVPMVLNVWHAPFVIWELVKI